MSECDIPSVLVEVSKILRLLSDLVKSPSDLRRPIPNGWVALGPARLHPRKPGDKHWSIAAGGWVDTPDDAIAYANQDDWPSIRKAEKHAPVSELVEGLSQAMQGDQDLAWTWHCNIAMASLDEGACPYVANLAAARFMRIAFGVDVIAFDQWKSLGLGSDAKPLAIPDGWRELEPNEIPLATDMHEWMGGWFFRNIDATHEYKLHSSRHIRQIETANPLEVPNSSTWIPKVGDKVRISPCVGVDCDRVDIVDGFDTPTQIVFLVGRPRGVELNLLSPYIEPAAPPADHIADATKPANPSEAPNSLNSEPLAIPEGWRELEARETPIASDMYEHEGRWLVRGGNSSVEYEWYDVRQIRKIETANPSETPVSSIPDPGQGYRLLSKDPPERLLDTDEGFFANGRDGGQWLSVNYSGGDQLPLVYYRRKIEPTKWIPKVGDKVRVVGVHSAFAEGHINHISTSGSFTIYFISEDNRFRGWVRPEQLKLIEASNCPVIPDSSAGELLVDTAVKFNDGSGTVPSLSGWTVEPDAYIGCLSVFPVPHGWMMICPDAKTEPRVIGDQFYRITKGQWEELTEANVEQANKQNWTAIRKMPSVVLESEKLLGSKPQYRDPTAADIGKTIEVRSEYCTLWEERELVSVYNEEIDNRFVCRHKNNPKRLKLWSNARVKVQEHIL